MFLSREQVHGAAGVVDVAFTDRHGGVSAPPYDSLDLSISAADRSAEVAENMDRVAAAFGVPAVQVMRQVHGSDVVKVRAPTGPAGDIPTCDALVSDRPGVALCARIGDCVPVVLADADIGVVAVAHAGRAGVGNGVVAATVRQMRAHGAEHVVAWLGPHICGGCYEVPERLRAEVVSTVPAAYACTTWGTASLDLGAAVRAQLVDMGVACQDTLAPCTRESSDLYSHRRDGAGAGRLGALVVLREGSGE